MRGSPIDKLVAIFNRQGRQTPVRPRSFKGLASNDCSGGVPLMPHIFVSTISGQDLTRLAFWSIHLRFTAMTPISSRNTKTIPKRKLLELVRLDADDVCSGFVDHAVKAQKTC
jgi:hypothetical protein